MTWNFNQSRLLSTKDLDQASDPTSDFAVAVAAVGGGGGGGGDSPLGTGDRDEATDPGPALTLTYDADLSATPDLYQVRYAPDGGTAEGLPVLSQATFILNERGLLRLQQASDQPDDIPFKIFGDPDTQEFGSDAMRIIASRLDQTEVLFAINSDGFIDNARYPWVLIDFATATSGKFGAPSGTTYTTGSVRKVASDRCEMRGSVDVVGSAIASGDVIGTIPAIYWPNKRARVTGTAGDGAQTERIEIGVDGILTCRTARASAAGYISFDGITYTL